MSRTFDRPFPDAVNVTTRYADVPSPRFPGLWQEGWIAGSFYRIWSNNEAVLQAGPRDPEWTIEIKCGDDLGQCMESREGPVPQDAGLIARDLAACLVDAEFSGREPEPVVESIPVFDVGTSFTSETTIDAAEEMLPPLPCGLQKIPEGSVGLTLQRLLIEAGGDPGPLDGFPGARTRRALVDVLGVSAAGLSETEAIKALDRHLCNEVSQ
ncbi:peptidoglycan-binding domain-containing protein [Shimia thalassica]|uniref:peptidoglycan-binding domain-containing protein n=1 Tax=Shimia thalassica TaxID=1715693 RepID=UPI002737590A|nr:hypothetical protein [Shimia thalassica]MDP2520885.1 hypothetical protein [Shimia thalassica]